MSVQAQKQHVDRVGWALPGGRHDRLVRWLKMILPAGVGAFTAYLLLTPFTDRGEVSFVLAKDSVDVAQERLRVREALYRGEDEKGRPFSIRAASAVQKTSREPLVQMQDLSARMLMREGPAVLTARQAVYDLDRENLDVVGPVQFEAAGGYRLTTSDVDVDMNDRRLKSRGQVAGRMPLGTFQANSLEANLGDRTVTLVGNATLRIDQNGSKGR